jgi:hypothetical protein
MKTQTIEQPIVCHCGFETKYGDEMRNHYQSKHDLVFSGMKYEYGWAVGPANAYSWLNSHSLELAEEGLRKCNNCDKPFIAYDHKDDCETCRKLPEIAIFPKYSRNLATSTHAPDSIYYNQKIVCDECGHVSKEFGEHDKHGVLVTLEDNTLRWMC